MVQYNLTKPCDNCPFSKTQKGFLAGERIKEIAEGLISKGEYFICHKTLEKQDEDQSHCAGALLFLEHQDLAPQNQSVRIAERLRLYDHTKLDMDYPVFTNIEDLIEHHESCEECI